MREFPSVLHFPEISEAHLTYPYHCCAFQFPITHDPQEFERLQSLRDVHRKFCERDGADHVTTPGVSKRFVSDGDEDDEDPAEVVYGHFVFTPSPDQFNKSVQWSSDIGQLLGEGSFHSVVGEHRNVEDDPQVDGPGCQLAGFLTVFSSELSVFTLTVITLERWYAITYAIHLNRRLHIGAAGRVMAGGWLYAASAAVAPIFGVSGYSRTSICLPMESKTALDVAYLVGLLTVKGVAFMLICVCYLKMYLSIRSSSGNRQGPDLHANRAVRSDLSVAKRMAMLVFTDFFCWAPIAFFGLTALIGHPLIDVTRSKILLVTFYPLNSCANPFLYAILTKQYSRDARLLLAGMGIVRRRSVHGRTLSTNVNQRRLSSVKTLCRGSFGLHPRQHIVLSSSGITTHRMGGGDFITSESKTPNFEKKKDEVYDTPRDGRIKKGSPAVHRGSPHPIRSNFTKVQHPDQQIILRRVLELPASSQVTTTMTTTTDVTSDDKDCRDTAV